MSDYLARMRAAIHTADTDTAAYIDLERGSGELARDKGKGYAAGIQMWATSAQAATLAASISRAHRDAQTYALAVLAEAVSGDG